MKIPKEMLHITPLVPVGCEVLVYNPTGAIMFRLGRVVNVNKFIAVKYPDDDEVEAFSNKEFSVRVRKLDRSESTDLWFQTIIRSLVELYLESGGEIDKLNLPEAAKAVTTHAVNHPVQSASSSSSFPLFVKGSRVVTTRGFTRGKLKHLGNAVGSPFFAVVEGRMRTRWSSRTMSRPLKYRIVTWTAGGQMHRLIAPVSLLQLVPSTSVPAYINTKAAQMGL